MARRGSVRFRAGLSGTLALLLVLLAAACSSSSKPSSSATTTPVGNAVSANNSAPVNGGTLASGEDTDPSSLDPLTMGTLTYVVGANLFFDVYGALLIANTAANPPQIQPLLAQSMTTPDNGHTWVLTLRPNLVFSDGTALNAAAVQYNWQRLANPVNHGLMASSMADVASMSASGQVLTIKLKTQNTLFPNTVAEGAMAFIGSPAAIQKEGKNFGTQPVGAGPFDLVSWVQGSKSVWKKSPTYFNAAGVHLAGLTVTPIFDSTQQVNAYTTGAVQLLFVGQFGPAAEIQKAGGVVDSFPLLGPLVVTWNVNKPPFNDQAMRVAFTEALNRTAISQAYNLGYAEPVPNTVLNSSSPYLNPSATYPPYNPSAAKTAIEAYIAQHGPIKLTILYVSGNPAPLDANTVIQQELEQIPGVTATLDGTSLAAYYTAEYQGNWNVSNSGLPFADVADPFIYDTFHTGGSFNPGGYSNPTVDAALDSTRKTLNPQQQQQDYDTVQSELAKDSYFVPFVNSLYADAYNSKIVHFYGFGDGIPRTDLIWCTGGVC